MEIGFRQMLTERQKKVNSLVCVGLDPLIEKLPAPLGEKHKASPIGDIFYDWMGAVVDATAPYASMYKPQSAHWESVHGGVEALQKLVIYIKTKYPDIPIFLDCKRGDIGRTQERYRVAHLTMADFDGMNFSPYMGKDCMEGLVDENNLGKALVGLCYTSNPAAREIQDILLAGVKTEKLWEFMAVTILKWAQELGVVENAGLVMAAAFENPKGSGKVYSEHLKRCRELIGYLLWFLIPGIGTQGGFIAETVNAAFGGPGTIAINSSSDIIFASKGEDFVEKAGKKAKELRDQIREAGGNCS